MADTVAYQIIEAIKTRLDVISTGNGFNTTPSAVVTGIQDPNPDELDAGPLISIYELGDAGASDDLTSCQTALIRLDVLIEAHVRKGTDSEAKKLSRLWQDIARAVFLPDTTLGGISVSVIRGPRDYQYPPQGGKVVSVRQQVNVQYNEPYGNP